MNRAGFNSQAIVGWKLRRMKCHFFTSIFLTISVAIWQSGSEVRQLLSRCPLGAAAPFSPLTATSGCYQEELAGPARNKYQALSKLTPEVDAGPFPTLCLHNVPLTCWVRGLYGELLSRSARMLVRESISASKLDLLSSSVLPPGFTLKKKEKFQLFKPLGLAHGFLLSSPVLHCSYAQQLLSGCRDKHAEIL